MKKTLLLVAATLMSAAAMAQDVFTREMPCKNNLGEVIANKMGTVCLPYAAEAHDCSVYKLVSATADKWVFQEVNSMEANTPYVFVVDNSTTLEASFEKIGEEVPVAKPSTDAAGVENAFVGSYRQTVIRDQIYFISNDKVNSSKGKPVLSTPNRGYFTSNVLPSGQTLSDNVKLVFLHSNSTAIQEVSAEEEAAATVSKNNIGLESGNYQINGKKVIVK